MVRTANFDVLMGYTGVTQGVVEIKGMGITGLPTGQGDGVYRPLAAQTDPVRARIGREIFFVWCHMHVCYPVRWLNKRSSVFLFGFVGCDFANR